MRSDCLLYAGVMLAALWGGGCERRISTVTDPDLVLADVAVPAALRAGVGDERLVIHWTVPAADSPLIARFIIHRSDSSEAATRAIDSIAWPPYVDSSVTNGRRYYYRVSARNQAGLAGDLSDAISATPSFHSVLINGDDEYTDTRDVQLTLAAPEATHVRVTNDSTQPGTWYTFQTNRAWKLSAGAGTKMVFAQFRLATGQQSSAWLHDSIVLDERAEILAVTLTDSVLLPADPLRDSLLIFAETGESGGEATYDLGSQTEARLYDDGLAPDLVADDGIYTGTYRARLDELFEQGTLEVFFRDPAGNAATPLVAPWKVSVRQAPLAPVWGALLPQPGDPSVLNLNWTLFDAEPFGQLLLRRDDVAGTGTTAPVVQSFNSPGATSHTDTGLAGSTTYYYTLEIVLANGLRALSDEASAATATDPVPAPVVLALQTTSDSTLTLSWSVSPAKDFESYRVYRATSSGQLSGQPGDDLLVKIITSNATTTYEESGLSQLYYYRVFVFDRAGQGAGSNIVSGPNGLAP